jgi:hypothetical protein
MGHRNLEKKKTNIYIYIYSAAVSGASTEKPASHHYGVARCLEAFLFFFSQCTYACARGTSFSSLPSFYRFHSLILFPVIRKKGTNREQLSR